MANDLVVQLGAKPIFWVVRATLPGQTKAHLAVFEDPEDAADHVTWLTPRAIGTIKTYECANGD